MYIIIIILSYPINNFLKQKTTLFRFNKKNIFTFFLLKKIYFELFIKKMKCNSKNKLMNHFNLKRPILS